MLTWIKNKILNLFKNGYLTTNTKAFSSEEAFSFEKENIMHNIGKYGILSMVMKVKKNIYIITLILVIIDQVVKRIIINSFSLLEVKEIIPDFFYFTYVENTGAAWSILEDSTFFLTVISAICLILLNRYLMKKNTFSRLEEWYYGLIMGGILGNFIDRVVRDGVVDYIGFQFGNYQFPIFNIADMAIVIGVGLVLLEMIKGDNHDRDRSKKERDKTRSVSKRRVRN